MRQHHLLHLFFPLSRDPGSTLFCFLPLTSDLNQSPTYLHLLRDTNKSLTLSMTSILKKKTETLLSRGENLGNRIMLQNVTIIIIMKPLHANTYTHIYGCIYITHILICIFILTSDMHIYIHIYIHSYFLK